MKFHTHPTTRHSSATDRTPQHEICYRIGTVVLALLIALPMITPALGITRRDAIRAEIPAVSPVVNSTVNPATDENDQLYSAGPIDPELQDYPDSFALLQGRAKYPATSLIYAESNDTLIFNDIVTIDSDISQVTEITETESDSPINAETDPNTPLTQEQIARKMESALNMQARGGSRIYYPYPAGAMAVDLYKDGRQILKGQVADIGGTVYVPVQRFADLFGSFKTVYTQATEQVVITGKNLSITVKVGDPYITVNERIFYTGKKVISLGGWIFVPLTSMCRALNAKVTIRQGYYDAFITSGDPTKVKWASEYYDSTDLYWLSRIISAEAKGEPFAGQIAVGNVVLNRVRSSQYPNTVKGVIFDTKYGTQFSPVASGTIYNTPTESSIRAAKICLEGYSLSTSMIYFYNPKIATSSWIGRTRPYIMTIGNHKFYG